MISKFLPLLLVGACAAAPAFSQTLPCLEGQEKLATFEELMIEDVGSMTRIKVSSISGQDIYLYLLEDNTWFVMVDTNGSFCMRDMGDGAVITAIGEGEPL